MDGSRPPQFSEEQIMEALDTLPVINYRYHYPQNRGYRRPHKTPPLFDPEELKRIRMELVQKFNLFTFHNNAQFYKPMDKIIDMIEKDPFILSFSSIQSPPLPLDVDLSRIDYIKSCSLIQMRHLELFNRRPREIPSQYVEPFRRAVQHVAALLELPKKLPMPTEDSLQEVRYDGSKFSGLFYARQGMKSRKDAHNEAMRDGRLVWKTLLRGKRVSPHDTRLGGKGKLVTKDKDTHGKIGDDGGLSMGRLILMLSHRDLLILGALEQPLTHQYLESNYPINIGQSWYYGGSAAFVNKIARHSIYHCFDSKKFDASIDPWLVREALLVLRNQFEDGMNPKYDTLWEFVYESLVDVIICRDDGIRMQKHVGTTSGNCFNTLVQSIITLFLGYTALIAKANERYGHFGAEMVLSQSVIEALGDDMVMALESPWSYLTKETLAGVVQDCFNIDWSGKKSFSTGRLTDDSTPETIPFRGVQFLGMYFRWQLWSEEKYAPKVIVPYRPFHESYLSLLFPKYGEYSIEHSWLRAIGIYYNAAGNTTTQEWLEKYLDYLESLDFLAPEKWPPHMEKLVTKDFWDIGIEAPRPRRISKEQWYRFACFQKVEDW
ncbi:hypothetical protein BGW38_006380 [Lunasporangiospora selenospora]|uniref:RdRp catalytic domain-containing protein n=1 Tax=Lunasporangiospora selenospora TaxID=979761 RepID=A0A9P6FZT9_9FUNG|nr:hypothetical protein BGW38_006380 [Lunasporangiospora selenospora]